MRKIMTQSQILMKRIVFFLLDGIENDTDSGQTWRTNFILFYFDGMSTMKKILTYFDGNNDDDEDDNDDDDGGLY